MAVSKDTIFLVCPPDLSKLAKLFDMLVGVEVGPEEIVIGGFKMCMHVLQSFKK